MKEIDKFFTPLNTVGDLSEQEQSQTGDYLEVIRAFTRITYKSVYIIDYQKKIFEFVSDNPLFLCGHTPEKVMELGYAFYFKNVKKEDLDLLLMINEAGFQFYESIAVEERKKYSISYDFHLMHDNKPILINQKLTPMFLAADGKIWKAMCIISLSSKDSAGNITVYKQGSDEVWRFDVASKRWHKEQKIKLTERETEILRLYAQGLKITDIALKLCVTADTVKFHRRRLFEKIGVQNITEALSYATNNKLL